MCHGIRSQCSISSSDIKTHTRKHKLETGTTLSCLKIGRGPDVVFGDKGRQFETGISTRDGMDTQEICLDGSVCGGREGDMGGGVGRSWGGRSRPSDIMNHV